MNYKECEFKYKCHYSNSDCNIIKNVCVHREKLIKISKLEKQNLELKEENDKLTQIANKALDDKDRLLDKNTTLKEKLKVAVEAINEAKNYQDIFDEYSEECTLPMQNILQQALIQIGEVE